MQQFNTYKKGVNLPFYLIPDKYAICKCDLFFSELCWGKAMVAYTMPQKRKKEESERLRGERDQMKLLILDLKDGKL